jgi:hypothetical protein
MRRKSDIGPQGTVEYMTAVSATNNIGGPFVDYVDADNFYPADGDLLDTENEIDKLDIPYDNTLNDLGPNMDYFDGDEQNSYADDSDDFDDFDDDFDDFDDDFDDFDDEDYENADGDYDIVYKDEQGFGLDEYDENVNDLGSDIDFFDGAGRPDYELYDDYADFDSDYDDLDGESFDYATGRRRRRTRRKPSSRQQSRRPRRRASGSGVGGFAKDRLTRRDARVDERRKARDERRKARSSAKSAVIQSRADLAKSVAQPDTTTAQVLSTLQGSDARTATTQTPRRGLSTSAIIGIAIGSLALLGLGAYFVLRKKK